MNSIEEITNTPTYKNHVFHIAMCDFANTNAPSMYFDNQRGKPVIRCLYNSETLDTNKDEIKIEDIPNISKEMPENKGKTLLGIYKNFEKIFDKYGYSPEIEPIDIKTAYGIKSYNELCKNEEFIERFSKDKEKVRTELMLIQKQIDNL